MPSFSYWWGREFYAFSMTAFRAIVKKSRLSANDNKAAE
jgi:hypothetical protein